MANELQISLGITYANGGLADNKAPATQKISQAAQELFAPVVSCPAADTVVTVAGITTLGWLYMKNLDPTNFVTYGPTVAAAIAPAGRLMPGEEVIFRLEPGIVLRTRANVAACKVQFKFYGN
jgi:hypothetical protein